MQFPSTIVIKKKPIISNPQPPTFNDEILKRLNEIELKVNEHEKSKLSYTTIYKFKILKVNKFRGKEDPRENIKQFKYSCYVINNDDVLILHNFPMTFARQASNWYNNLPQHSIYSFM